MRDRLRTLVLLGGFVVAISVSRGLGCAEEGGPAWAAQTLFPGDRALSGRLRWDSGLHYELTKRVAIGGPDGSIPRELVRDEISLKGNIGAKLAVDAAGFLNEGDFPDIDNGAEVRRARLYTVGDFHLVVPMFYKFEFSVVGTQFLLEEAFLGFRKVPVVQQVIVGNTQTPMSLEAVISGRDLTFMEVAVPVEAFSAGIKPGILIGGPVFDQRATWALGWFGGGGEVELGKLSGITTGIGRVTWLPRDRGRDAASEDLIHVGASGSVLVGGDDPVRYQARPESHLAPYLVNTGDIPTDTAIAIGLEAAVVRGPWSFQSEYFHAIVNEKGGGTLNFGGFYLYASWFATGESRPYDRTAGVFGRVKPRRDLSFRRGGLGAVELGVRYSHVDLNDGAFRGGIMDIGMLGVNWYWTPFLKTRVNYGVAGVSGRPPGGVLKILQGRFELDF